MSDAASIDPAAVARFERLAQTWRETARLRPVDAHEGFRP